MSRKKIIYLINPIKTNELNIFVKVGKASFRVGSSAAGAE
jgi:hypothetical protein